MADAGITIEVPIYGLAAKHSFVQASAFLTQAYRKLPANRGGGQIR